MSTFKQIVEGYAGNIEQQRRSMDYEGANDRAIDKIKERNTNEIDSKLEQLPTKVRLANTAYSDGFSTEFSRSRWRNTSANSDVRSSESHKAGNAYRESAVNDFDNSFNEILNNPNLSTKHLVSLHAIVDGISDNSTLGSKKHNLHRAILSHKNSDKQIVEGYAGNVEQQRRSMDYEGANDRAIDKIKERNTNEIDSKLEQLPTKLRLANKAYTDGYYREYNSGRHMSSDARSVAAHKVGEEYMKTHVKNFDNSFNELLNNPNLSTKHLVRLHAIVDGILDNSTLGSRKHNLHRAILSHKNSDDFVRGFHYARTGHNAPWKNIWDE